MTDAADAPSAPTAGQLRAARAWLGWSRAQVIAKARLSYLTLQRAEAGTAQPSRRTMARLVLAYRGGGVAFHPDSIHLSPTRATG